MQNDSSINYDYCFVSVFIVGVPLVPLARFCSPAKFGYLPHLDFSSLTFGLFRLLLVGGCSGGGRMMEIIFISPKTHTHCPQPSHWYNTVQ